MAGIFGFIAVETQDFASLHPKNLIEITPRHSDLLTHPEHGGFGSFIIDRFTVNGSFLSHPMRGGIGALIKYLLRVFGHYVTSFSYIQS
ncbi:hypothetical protein [Membranihabitans marinus]|uniref:hypothetical protein n=1 Tax=Membranihabitans marinus TaxID=1227546 RepID=UPI001F26BFA1|nr:hypothetical protein [Membranihabitans marinus]